MDQIRPVSLDWNEPEAEDEASWCLQCGKSLADFTTAYVRRYCSVECRNDARRDRDRQLIGPPCLSCGRPVRVRSNRDVRFCSRKCFGVSITGKPRPPRKAARARG